MNATVFLYAEVLHQPLGDIGEFLRVQRPARLPEVLSREETRHCRLVMARAVHSAPEERHVYSPTQPRTTHAPAGLNGCPPANTVRPAGAWVVLGWVGL